MGKDDGLMFSCDKCGLCCRRVGQFAYMHEYDRGDGVCKHLTDDNLCAIYDSRPDICNTDKMYERVFASKMSREDFDKMNMDACVSMKGSNFTHNQCAEHATGTENI